MKEKNNACQGAEKEFIDLFSSLVVSRSDWQVWSDLMAAMACAIANTLDPNEKRKADREKEYTDCIKRLGSQKTAAEIFAVVIAELDHDPDQDFLGKIYMNLGLGSHWKGQFFTPFTIGQMIADTDLSDGIAKEQINRNGWTSVEDPSCGAGCTLIAAASTFRKQKINYQQHVIFIGQDIDRVTAQMCFIQLSLLGCPGYIVVADTLTNPICGSVLAPHEKDNMEFWYTPMWWSDIWTYRRMLSRKVKDYGSKGRT